MTLCNAIAHIGGKVAGRLAAVVVDRLHGLLDELIQMGAAGMAVAEGALHHDLGLGKILDLPAHTHLQGSFSGAKVRTSCERNSIFITSKYCLLSSFFCWTFL